jgi:acyl-CoA hydrolase
MEVFVKIIAEDLKSSVRRIAATALLTFVALDEHKRPTRVPKVIPETEEALDRASMRQQRKQKSKDVATFLNVDYP